MRERWQIDKLRAYVGDDREVDFVSPPKCLARDLLDALEMIALLERSNQSPGLECLTWRKARALLAAHGMGGKA